MQVKNVNRHTVDVFFNKGWGDCVRFDLENDRVLFSTFDSNSKVIAAIRRFFHLNKGNKK